MSIASKDIVIDSYPLPNCYLCRSNGSLLYSQLRDDLFGTPGDWNLKHCTNSECGLAWLDPMPKPSELSKAYQDYYTHSSRQSGAISSKNPFLALAKESFGYLKRFLVLIPGTNRQRLLSNNLYLQGCRPGRLLDIGCGSGQFLQQMQIQGWEVEGVDFDEMATESARTNYGLRVHTGDLRDIAYPDNSFDAITLNNVIEHLPEPVEVVKECRRILRPGGRLVIVTPNFESLGRRRLARYWRGLEPPRHLFLFSPKNLAMVAQIAEFNDFQSFSSTGGLGNGSSILENSIIREQKSLNRSNSRLLKNGKMMILSEILLMLWNPNLGEWAVLLATKAIAKAVRTQNGKQIPSRLADN